MTIPVLPRHSAANSRTHPLFLAYNPAMGRRTDFGLRELGLHSLAVWATFALAVWAGAVVAVVQDPNVVTGGSAVFAAIGLIGGAIVPIALWAPVAWGIGWMLRTVRPLLLHLLAFAVLGAAAGALLDLIVSWVLDVLVPWGVPDPGWEWTRRAIVAAVAAFCTAVGRLVAWSARSPG